MVKFEVFEDFADFLLNREDKNVNGVSKSFIEEHPDYESSFDDCEDFSGCWNLSDLSDCWNLSDRWNLSGLSDCRNLSGCWNLSGLSGCWNLSGLSGCWNLSDERIKPENILIIPKIENIHQAVYLAASACDALNMSTVHECETTHCRAGWVVTLAGKEGKELEQKTSWNFAANAIYRSSSNIEVGMEQFFKSNDDALADMKRCADEEAIAQGEAK